jgi:hypothetical protein
MGDVVVLGHFFGVDCRGLGQRGVQMERGEAACGTLLIRGNEEILFGYGEISLGTHLGAKSGSGQNENERGDEEGAANS